MYLLLCSLLLVYVGIYWINVYALGFFLFIYALSYFDGKEYTGERRWTFFRSWRIWQWLTPMDYAALTPQQARDLELVTKVKRLYLMVPGDTIISLVWGIGLHGGRLTPAVAEKLHYIVPPIYLWIPLLRDVLLWTGAITYHAQKRPLNSILLDMLNSNRSVCYCPSELANVTLDEASDLENAENGTFSNSSSSPCPDAEILNFALQESIQLVPIVVHGERRRYHMLHIRFLQRFFFKHINYPFPLLFFPRIFNKTRPPLLILQMGFLIECNEKFAKSPDILKGFFIEAIAGMTARELGDDEMKLL
jgi:hypothetical protein